MMKDEGDRHYTRLDLHSNYLDSRYCLLKTLIMNKQILMQWMGIPSTNRNLLPGIISCEPTVLLFGLPTLDA